MDNTESRTLELDLECGKRVKVQVTSFHLDLPGKLHTGENGKEFKLGTFKIHDRRYREWGRIKKIKYCIGECFVLNDEAPKETPRTITFKVRHDFG
ncbi:hypothetical protein BR1R5_50700 [Pseudomonas sp. BR1R-5]|nr:hypothetical protein PVLB_05565 [Pseudomonas sp. VLB120]GLH35681.1 hypothetical protein BR1R5_50700 [Pseudomonas sp. BR1R-5]